MSQRTIIYIIEVFVEKKKKEQELMEFFRRGMLMMIFTK